MLVESIGVRALPRVGEVRHREDLLTYLQCAIELEHTTLPVYVCALYSLHEDTNHHHVIHEGTWRPPAGAPAA